MIFNPLPAAVISAAGSLPGSKRSQWASQLLKTMRITAILLFACAMQVAGRTHSQTVSITGKNISLEKVLSQVKEQTGFNILYDYMLIRDARPITIEANNILLTDFLKKVLENQDLSFSINKTTIVIKKKTGKPTPDVNVSPELSDAPPIRIKVTDSLGHPLLGVTVAVNSKIFGFTNADGEVIANVKPDDVLEFTSIGFQTITRKAGTSKQLNIILRPLEVELSSVEVTVSTGYQNIPKDRATGSFKTIDKEQLERPSSNIGQRLIGTTAGLAATMDANGNPTFRIRGLTTLGAVANPLIVLDGFPLEGATFNEINPNNVETISVLKDAAAASIWGSRAANGVIVITTKSGKRGIPLSVDISAFTRIGSKVDLDYLRPHASSAETVEFEKLAFGKWNNNANAGTLNTMSQGPMSEATSLLNEYRLGRITLEQRDQGLERLATLDNRQQIRDHILNNPVTNQVNINITGSTRLMRQASSMLFETNTTNFKGTDSKRAMLNYRMDADIASWLNFEAGLMLQYRHGNNNGMSLSNVTLLSPYDMLLNEDGSYNKIGMTYYMPSLELLVQKDKFPYDFYYNPVREINARDYTSQTMHVRVQAGLTAKIIKGLSVSSKVMYENINGTTRNIDKEDSYEVRNSINGSLSWNLTPTGAVTLNLPKGAQMRQSRAETRAYNFRNQIDFNRRFGNDHLVVFAGGSELRENILDSVINPRVYGYNEQTLTSGQFPNGPGGSGPRAITNWLGRAVTFPYTHSFAYYISRYYSLFSNLSYTFKEKYTVSGSYRTDASNFIAATPKARYSPFWSVGGLWHAGREDFLANYTWLDKLALRVTYGVNGNEDRSTSPFPLISVSSSPNVNTSATTATIASFGNPLLRWEKTYVLNAGIDFSVFRGKLFGSVEVYSKRGKDLLATLDIPIVNGTGSQRLNNVEMNNKGIDIDLGSSLAITRDIRWRGNVTFSYNDNKIIKLFRTQYTSANLAEGGSGAYVEGYNANTLWSYYYGGFVNNNPVYLGPDKTPINFTQFLSQDARSWMNNGGVTVAPYTASMINNFDIYNFTVSAIITGKFGHVFRRSSFNYPFQTFSGRLLPNVRLSEVLNADPSKMLTLPMIDNDPNYQAWRSVYPMLDYLVESAAHLRLQEVSISYNFKPSMINKIGASGLRVFAQGNDLLTISDNTYNEDPEFVLGTLNPTPRFTFGFKLQF